MNSITMYLFHTFLQACNAQSGAIPPVGFNGVAFVSLTLHYKVWILSKVWWPRFDV
jgi:hypothetical protein